MWVTKFSCQSFTDSDKVYVVSVDDNGKWGCSCPAWKFSRHRDNNGKRVDCQHIIQVKEVEGWKTGDVGTILRLKAKAVESYRIRGKSDQEITRRLARNATL